MTARRAVVRFTANFEANLAAIAKYWRDREAPDVFLTVLDELDTAVGHLERHPRIGRRFFARTAQSVEARQRVAELSRRFGDADVREYLSGDYLLLYTIRAAGPGSRTAAKSFIFCRSGTTASFRSISRASGAATALSQTDVGPQQRYPRPSIECLSRR